ncbi:hypothetical protein OCU04_007498 [Sclerotinia nivalis]|uniref:Berberine/berberine-like domain-containing protein n=1 Tax=Sclerotinia nivalis TaxID=352851 RepID=A0A9X0DIG8_9HELO|nr:hypothetical protein OCU04_007498 [Sclerotinia nivalis]
MGFSPLSTPQKNLVMILISDFWTDPASEAPIRASLKALIASIDSISQQEGKFVLYKYLNYAADFQDPLSTTGRKGFQQIVAKKYDPVGMFQTQAPGKSSQTAMKILTVSVPLKPISMSSLF